MTDEPCGELEFVARLDGGGTVEAALFQKPRVLGNRRAGRGDGLASRAPPKTPTPNDSNAVASTLAPASSAVSLLAEARRSALAAKPMIPVSTSLRPARASLLDQLRADLIMRAIVLAT